MEGENRIVATPTMCRSGCGFYGSTSTDGLCSKCYKDTVKNQETPANDRTSPSTINTDKTEVPSPVAEEAAAPSEEPEKETSEDCIASPEKEEAECTEQDEASSSAASITPKKKNRCGMCRKRVGLTGFGCRCGGLYCSTHRYSDKHECSFDYKKVGAEEIRKNNPVIAASKVHKI